MTVSGYTIDVYCDFGDNAFHFNQSHKQYADDSKRVAWRMVKAAGWVFRKVNGNEVAMCPACIKAGKRFDE